MLVPHREFTDKKHNFVFDLPPFQSYIKCKHINYESGRTEPFYDIQLNIKGKKSGKKKCKDR